MPDMQKGNWDLMINSGAFSTADPINAYNILVGPNPMIKAVNFDTSAPDLMKTINDTMNAAVSAKTFDDQLAQLMNVNKLLTDNNAFMYSILEPQWHMYDNTKFAGYTVDGASPQPLFFYAYAK